MSRTNPFPLIAVDVGNSRVKFALFDNASATSGKDATATLPIPSATHSLDPREDGRFDVSSLLNDRPAGAFTWHIGSVERKTSARLLERLREAGATRVVLLASGDLPLAIQLPRPDMVGIDRLLGAVAANHVRNPQRPAVVVSLGSAITVNLITAQGAFVGGAILPGISMSARALNQFTDLLPLIDMHSLSEPPPPVGDATVAAMTSGLYWGAVGGVRYLIELFAQQSGGEADVFLTGGAAPSVAKLLPGNARYEPNLVTTGIALAAAATSNSWPTKS